MFNQKILFPNDKAITKYNIDKNGLYLNDELGYKEYSSPYLGVKKTKHGFAPIFNIPKEIERKIINSRLIKEAENKGFDYFTRKGNFPIELDTYNDPRKAAYISQKLLFSENNDDLIECLIYHMYVKFDEEIDNMLDDIPDFMYEPVNGFDYDPKDEKYHFKQEEIDDAKKRLIAVKQAKIKRDTINKNISEFIDRMKKYADKIGYKYDVMTLDLAKKLMNMKFDV